MEGNADPSSDVLSLEKALLEEQREHHQTKQQLRRVMEFAPEGIVILDVATGKFVDANPRAEEIFGLPRDKLLQVGPFDVSPSQQADGASGEYGRRMINQAVTQGVAVFEWWHQNARGERFPCEVRLVKVPIDGAKLVRGTIVDITERKQFELYQRGRSQILEQIARGLPLPEALKTLVGIVESTLPGMICSILILDSGGQRLHRGVAPGLPDFYNAAVDGLPVGPENGSCGAAAYHGRRVIVSDVLEHPNWRNYREMARRAQLRACWSEPVKSLDGKVLGTFAMYYHEPREPMEVEIRAIEFASQLAGIAIEHDNSRQMLEQLNHQLQQLVNERTRALQATSEELSAAQERLRLAAVSFNSYDSMIVTDPTGHILRVNDSFTRLTGYTAAEALGKTPRILKSGRHDQEFYRQMWSKVCQEGHWEGEVWNKHKDGHVFPQRLSISAVKDENGKVTHYVGDGQDITAQKAAARARMAIDVARDVQQSLLPWEMPRSGTFDIAGEMHAAESIGGDFFDFLYTGGNLVAVVIADISGHGLGPALLAARLQAYFRAAAELNESPQAILTSANRQFCRDRNENFATAFIGLLDLQRKTLVYASAGHQGYLLDAAGEVRILESTGLPLGIIETAAHTNSATIQLREGDTFLLATDGIDEARRHDDAMFGGDRMVANVQQHLHQPAKWMVKQVLQEVREFVEDEPQEDDMTIVISKVAVDLGMDD